MDIPNVVLPVFAVIVTGWLAGAVGYLPRTLAGPLVGFAYNVAMPALIFVTIAPEPVRELLDWGFLAAFGGGSILCFAAVFAVAHARASSGPTSSGLGSNAMYAAAASMTNTGFVALPILQALYGPRGVLPAAIATVFVAVAMFPILIVLLEMDRRRRPGGIGALALANRVVTNPLMISTILGLAWSIGGLPVPAAFAAYATIFADALTPCALFSIGLGLSFAGLRGDLVATAWLAVGKLVVMPLVVYGLCLACRVDPFYTVAAVVCAAVPTAKTAYVLAGEYRVEESMVAATISITTLLSVVTLLGWLYALS
jgi:malonate transporter and related proteins